MHVTQAWGGGVQKAISMWSDLTPEYDHHAVTIARAGQATQTSSNLAITDSQGGIPGLATSVRRVRRRIRPDIVHLHSSIAGVLRISPGRTPVVYSPHCYAFERRDVTAVERAVYRTVEKALSRRQQIIAAVSPHEAWLARSLRDTANTVVVPNPPQGPSSPLRTPTGRRVVSVGRISRQKDPKFFAEVAEAAKARIEFRWVGDGDAESRALLEHAGVEVTGWATPTQIASELRAADLYLHTAEWEASPFSLIEAVWNGLPVLCRDIPALRSLGYPTATGDAASVAKSVEEFLTDSHAARSLIAAHDKVTAWMSVEATARALSDVYASALGES